MDNIFLFIVGIFMIVFYANRGGDRETVEGFNDTISKMSITDLQNLIYSTYKADVQAIKNLADTAAKLQAGGLTVPGNLAVSGNISGPTVNTINDKITNAINTLNTNINNTKRDLQTETNQKVDTTRNTINGRIDNLFNANITIGGSLIMNQGNVIPVFRNIEWSTSVWLKRIRDERHFTASTPVGTLKSFFIMGNGVARMIQVIKGDNNLIILVLNGQDHGNPTGVDPNWRITV